MMEKIALLYLFDGEYTYLFDGEYTGTAMPNAAESCGVILNEIMTIAVRRVTIHSF